jgi:ABC-type multidrug transport system fused ATPase/permease subunit
LYGQFQQAIGATRRIFELLDTRSEITNPPNPERLAKVLGHVTLNDVHFIYPGERCIEVLKGITVEPRPGEIIALVGAKRSREIDSGYSDPSFL